MPHALSPWLDATVLTTTLLHALWIGALVPLVAWALLAVLPARRASLRHAIATGAVFLSVALTAGLHGALVAERAHAETAAATPPLVWPTPAAESADRGVFSPDAPTVRGSVAQAPPPAQPGIAWRPILCGLWLAGVAFSLLRTARGVGSAKALGARGAPAPPWLQDRADRLLRRMGRLASARTVSVRLLDDHAQPVCVGLLRPVVLLPSSLVAGEPGVLRFVLAHEFAHARGLHPLVAVATEVAASVLFFHPGVRWLVRQAALERECVADLAAARACGDDPEEAAATLGRAAVPSARRATPIPAAVLALSSPATGVLSRMKRLLSPADVPGVAAPRGVLPVVLAAAVLLAGVQRGATALAEAVLDGPAFVARAAELQQTSADPRDETIVDDGTLRGRIRADAGSVEAADIRLAFWTRSPRGTTLATGNATVGDDVDGDGFVFEASSVAPGVVYVTATAPGAAASRVGPIELGSGKTVEDIQIDLGFGFSASLLVVDGNGTPVPGASVAVGSIEDFDVDRLNVYPTPAEHGDDGAARTTAADGTVAVDHLAGVPYQLDLAAEGFQNRRLAWTPTGGETLRISLEPAMPSGGRVVDHDGHPLANARIWIPIGFDGPADRDPRRNAAPPARATTDADGRFLLPALPVGSRGSVWAEAEGFGPSIFWGLTAGSTEWELALRPAIGLRVVVAPAADGLVSLPSELYWQQTVETRANGNFFTQGFPIVPFVPTGDGGVEAVLEGNLLRSPLTLRIDDFSLDIDDPASAGVIRLDAADLLPPPARRVIVRLVPPPGWPVPEGTLGVDTVAHERWVPYKETVRLLPIENGTVAFGVPLAEDGGPGVLTLSTLDAAGYRVESEQQREIVGGDAPLEIELPALPAGTVHGRITGPAGVPLPREAELTFMEWPMLNDSTTINPSSAPWQSPAVSAEGRFSVSGFPLGGIARMTVVSEDGFTVARSEPFTLDLASPNHEINLELPAGTDVPIEVMGTDGEPAAGVLVRVLYPDPDDGALGKPVRTDARGRVVLPGLNLAIPGGLRVGVVPQQEPGAARGVLVPLAADRAAGETVVIRLEPGVSASGRVIDKASGEPLVGRGVWIGPRGNTDPSVWDEAIRGQTGPDGRFTVHGLSPIAYRVRNVDAAHTPNIGEVSIENGKKVLRVPEGWTDPAFFEAPADGIELQLNDLRPR